MKIKLILIEIIFVFISSAVILPQVNLNKTAQSTMNFLLVGTSPRACALGEAFTSIGAGSESMFYNPSGLTEMKGTVDVSVNYTMWIADINYLSGGIAYNLNDFGVIGLNLLTVDYGAIYGTSLAGSLTDIGYIDNGELGNVNAYAVGISYAKSISTEFSLGGTVKLVGQNLGGNYFGSEYKKNDASILAFDAGVKYNTYYKGFVFGMSIRNFASNLKREEIDEQLPLIFAMGASVNLMEVINPDFKDPLFLAIDFNHQNNYSERVNLGIEYKLLDMISLRGGYQTNRDLASWSGGIGINQTVLNYNLEVNYSYSKFEIFDNVNRLSLLISF